MSYKSLQVNKDIAKIHFYIVINNISELTTFESKMIFVRSQPWFVKLAKIENNLCVYLHLLNNDKSNDWSMVAMISVKIICSKNIGAPHQSVIGPMIFDSDHIGCGNDAFISWNELMEPKHGYVTNDECRFKIKIKAGPILNEPINRWIKFEINRKCCDNSSYANFQLTINKLYESFAICSPKFSLNNMQWRILAIKGNDLQILLWNVNGMDCMFVTKTKCELKSFSEIIVPIRKEVEVSNMIRTPFDIFSIAWNDLNSPEKHFIENGSFKLEIEIKMNHPEEPPKMVTLETNIPCPICIMNMIGRDVSATMCGHIFCTECIKNSMRNSSNCPMCKEFLNYSDHSDFDDDWSDEENNTDRFKILRRVYLPSN